MAYSGSGGAYYRANNSVPDSAGLRNLYTVHCFVQASASPSTANYQVVGGFVGGDLFPQRPQEWIYWNHMTPTFTKSMIHRDGSGNYTQAQIASTPSANTWHSIAGLFDGSNERIYLNGALEGVGASAATSAASQCYIGVMAQMTFAGALEVSSNFAIGQVAEFAVWNVNLTADEIVSLSKGFRANRIRPDRLIEYFPMVRTLSGLKGISLLNQAGTDVVTDHPRVIG
jgi:hypothetical protein